MISIILQAGGKSSRMGTDKALLPFLGVPLIQRLRDRFSDAGQELLVITNHPDGYEFLGLRLQQDLIPDRGALGGLYTALAISSQPLLGLIAADLPFADPGLIKHLVRIIQAEEADAVIPSTSGGIEPMHAVYRVKTCLPRVKDAIEKDLWKMVSWHDQAKVIILDPEQTRLYSASNFTFQNLNTPEEFQVAEGIASELKDF